MTTVTRDYWRFGESAEAGNEPKLRKGEQVEEVGPRDDGVTHVETADGRIERVMLTDLIEE